MAEQLANFAWTTITTGYTAGSGTMIVASTGIGSGLQPFPASAVFSVVVADAVTGLPKALLEVTAIPDGTHFTVLNSGGVDANANVNDVVYAVVDKRAMTAYVAQNSGGAGGGTNKYGPIASLPVSGIVIGDTYTCTDSPYRYVWTGSAWDATVLGYRVTEPKLANFTQVNVGLTTFDQTHGGLVMSATNNLSSENVQIISQPIPGSGAYYVDVAFIPTVLQNGGTGAGVSSGNAPSNSFSMLDLGWQSTTPINLNRKQYNSTTSFNNNAANQQISAWGPLVWMRVFDDRTTNLTYYVSMNGFAWEQIQQEGRTSFMTPAVGVFALQPFNSAMTVHLVHFSIHA